VFSKCCQSEFTYPTGLVLLLVWQVYSGTANHTTEEQIRQVLRSHKLFSLPFFKYGSYWKMFRTTYVLCIVQIFVGSMGLSEITKFDLSFVWRRILNAPRCAKFKYNYEKRFYTRVRLFKWAPAICTLKVIICTCSGLYHRPINKARPLGCKRINLRLQYLMVSLITVSY
jgi:hypothetical protein